MKRIGKKDGLIEEIVSDANLNLAIDTVIRTKKRKHSRGGRAILKNRQQTIDRLRQEISSGQFRLTGYEEYEVKDSGKMRKVQSVKIYERIGCSAIMGVVEKHIRSKYIRTTGSSIERRGMHDLLNKIRADLAQDPEGMKYVYKCDIRKLDTGREYKTYTGDKENYSILEQMREHGLPIIASVEPIKCKGFTRYRLC